MKRHPLYGAPMCSACDGCFFEGFTPRTLCGPCERAIPKVNARILVSRNKREGGYLGWRKLGPSKRFPDWDNQPPGHQRLGGEMMWSTLRQRSRA